MLQKTFVLFFCRIYVIAGVCTCKISAARSSRILFYMSGWLYVVCTDIESEAADWS